MNASTWPLNTDRCEPNLPVVGEAWSAATGLVIMAAGLLPLFSSRHSDDIIDFVCAMIALNGAAAALSHSTFLGVFGTADLLSINFGALLFVKVNIMTHTPQLHERPISRGLVNLFIVFILLFFLSWNKHTVPHEYLVYFDPTLLVTIVCAFVATGGMLKLAYGKANSHQGKPKRVFLRATIFHLIGTACWAAESSRMPLIPISGGCGTIFSFMHPVWHLCEAQALMGWIAFLKYHRGNFFGFKVKLRGWWWCPFAVWLEPENAEIANSNPIIRHARSQKRARAAGRRNTYVDPEMISSVSGWHAKTAWRGDSFVSVSTSKPTRAEALLEAAAEREASLEATVLSLTTQLRAGASLDVGSTGTSSTSDDPNSAREDQLVIGGKKHVTLCDPLTV